MQQMRKGRTKNNRTKNNRTKNKKSSPTKSTVRLARRAELKKWSDIGIRSVAAATRSAGEKGGNRTEEARRAVIDIFRPRQDNNEDTTMSSNQSDRKYREAMEGASNGFGSFGRASNGVANGLTGSAWNTIAGLQEYNEKLIEIAQNNINMTLDFLQRTARTKSPSDFITVATEHARRQYETSTEQAKELAVLAQSLVLGATKPMAQLASRSAEKES